MMLHEDVIRLQAHAINILHETIWNSLGFLLHNNRWTSFITIRRA